ncbi:roadblock/LC7 domain-containing protein [Kutzneria viridogrisea]|uniref:Roadblock/LAMTOR2 domain-containing protein n=2 Tax=Kutzneria TaxID=43356 RepID=W5WF59_9PSEU|nr:roadblock/LC7 domain-containing protein [Kutzneria albida]AHH99395.1 hypothetical protein KALB_6035 [Kutzneria albida DSM 43870]MBA8923049.1 hypothetical protein [Kutzneria viridogrisea]
MRSSEDYHRLVTEFTRCTPGAEHSVVVSSDGLLLCTSDPLAADRSAQLAAVVSGLVSLADGASDVIDGGAVRQAVVEMRRGVLLLVSLGRGARLAVLAGQHADIAVLARAAVELSEGLSALPTPDPRENLVAW